jgi:cell division protein FtsW
VTETRPVRHPGELRWETRLLGVVTLVLLAFGVAATYGAASLVTMKGKNVGLEFAARQLTGAVLGGLLLLWASRQDYYRWRTWAWPLLLVTIGFLLVPLLPFTRAISPALNGARRWVDIGPLNFQPSELARLAVVVWCAMLASKKGAQVRDFRKGVLPFIVVLGVVSTLILLEPNLSMATLVAFLGGLVLFAAGARIGHFILLGTAAVLLVFHQIRDAQYRLARVLTFLNPGDAATEAGFQIHQSLVGIGSGGLFGTGFGQGQQKLGYLPYAYSDFLFSTIGEEWGFAGVLVVVLLFALFCWLGFRIAKTAAEPFGQYLAVGLTATIGLTAFMHMAVSLGLMPTTGLTLPFMSYGRSSQVISLLGTGILISIGRLRGKPRAGGRADGRALPSRFRRGQGGMTPGMAPSRSLP